MAAHRFPFVILKVFGGIGNQFMQYAFARWLESTYNWPVILVSNLGEQKPSAQTRVLQLNELFPDARIVRGSRAELIHFLSLSRKFQKTVGRKFLSHQDLTKSYCWKHVTAALARVSPHSLPVFSGYFQFKEPILAQLPHMRGDARRSISLRRQSISPSLRSLGFNCERDCIIHIRRGDYQSAGLPMLGPDYYREAAARLASQGMDGRYFVCSDEPESAIAILAEIGIRGTCIPLEDPLDVIAAIAGARFKIIANSTLSFCGAALGDTALTAYPTTWPQGGKELSIVADRLGWMAVSGLSDI